MPPTSNSNNSSNGVMRTTTISIASHAIEEDEVCLYPSKKCTNLRARKKNGELHTMCEYHRIRANENQRRLERRRKAAMRFPHHFTPKQSLWNREFPEPIPIPFTGQENRSIEIQTPPQQNCSLSWQPIEIEILLACLFDDGDDAEDRWRQPASQLTSLLYPPQLEEIGSLFRPVA